ncbi:MAG: hypothetical protein ACREXY_25770, partial [Gammaproteobacteria bacterium]
MAVRQACAGYVREHGVVQGSWPRGARAEEPVVDAAIESPIVIEGYWNGNVPFPRSASVLSQPCNAGPAIP